MLSTAHLRLIYKWRGRLGALPAIFLVFCRYGEIEYHWVFAVGAGIFLSGVLVRVVAQEHLHYRLRAPVVLTVTGLYGYVRNPIYIGNIVILCGLCFLAELVWCTPFMVAWSALVYSLVVRHEEAELPARYGTAYTEYLEHVPRWIPQLRPRCAPWQAPAALSVRRYFWPSIAAELHCVLWPIAFVLKELV